MLEIVGIVFCAGILKSGALRRSRAMQSAGCGIIK